MFAHVALSAGFFIDNRLYGKANALAAPFDYGAYRAQKVKDKLEAERASHIAPRRKLPKVNAALAARLLASGEGGEDGDEEEDARANADGERAAVPAKLLRDERFAALFSDTDFAVDETDATYKALHPNAPPASFSRALLEEHYEAVDADDDDAAPEPERRGKNGRAAPAAAAEAPKQPRMFAARGEAEANAFAARQSLTMERTAPLGQRAREANPAGARTNVRHGAQEMTFFPSSGRGDGGGRGGGRSGGGRGGGGRGRGRDGGDAPGHKRRKMQFGGK